MRSRVEIEADLTELYAARRKRLVGGAVVEVTHASGGTKKEVATLEEINQAIALLELELSRVTGQRSNLGPVRIGFGDRP